MTTSTSRRYGAVIWDMDGVLLDSEALHFAALNEVLAIEGLRLEVEEYEKLLGTTFEETWSLLHGSLALPRPLEEYMNRYEKAILVALNGDLDPAPGVRHRLAELKEAGVPIALASASRRHWIEATLNGLNLSDLFPIVVSGDDVAQGKPEPDIFLLAAGKLGVPADRCLVIEDAPNGVTAARRAGMDVVAVRTPHTLGASFDQATHVVDSLEDLDLAALGALPATA